MSEHLILALLTGSSAIATAIAWARARHWHCELGRHRNR
jgi:hypothetical protein